MTREESRLRRPRARSLLGALAACGALASIGSAQGYAWGVRALRHGEVEVRIDEAGARRELRLDAQPSRLSPATAQRPDARAIHASYADAAAREGRMVLSASVLESKVLRFWLQAEIAFERARAFGLELPPGEGTAGASLDGFRGLLVELCVAARASGEREAFLALATVLTAAEWPPQLADAEREEIERRLAGLAEIGAFRAEAAPSGSAWGRALRQLDAALGAEATPAALESVARVLSKRPEQRAALVRWAALESAWRGPQGDGLFVDGEPSGALLRRAECSWPSPLPADAGGDLGRALVAFAGAGRAADWPALRAAAWRELWSDVDAQVLARLEDFGALEACARAAARQGAGLDAGAPRLPEVESFAPQELRVLDGEDELWIAPELGALPHTAYLRRAADGFGALARLFEDRLGAELAATLRCWSEDTSVGLDVVAELRHLEDLHRGALALVCDQLGLDWKRTGHEKLYRALGGRDLATRFTAELGADPLLRGDLRRVIAAPLADGRMLCRACVGVAVWHGVLRYVQPPPVSLYQDDGTELPSGRLGVGFQDAPIRVPHEIWIAFVAAEAPSDEAWRAACDAAGDLEELRARFAR
ncbi:MAG: hypothetical protein IPN34_08185 [Planctomycetes bacterium]|nr:hypothetical protein [Planctomycetota bacterium]